MPRSGVADLAQHADRDDVARVHLGGQRVDVDDRLVARSGSTCSGWYSTMS